MKLSFRWLAALAIGLLIPTFAEAQTEQGKVTGSITDQSNAVLPGVVVTLKSVDRGSDRTTVTNSKGEYVFASVVPGSYEVTSELSGFSTSKKRALVTVGATVAVDFALAIGGKSEFVEVVGEAAQVNTSTQDIATTVNETQIRELPSITRNPYDFVSLSGQASRDTESDRGLGFAINGARSASTNILLDGSSNNDDFTATLGQAVPLDAVQEFSVLTSNFSAQYGRASGGIVNLATKSGTNQFHGTVYEFFRDDSLAANTFDNNSNEIAAGTFNRNQMGFSVGGPIVPDKVHFFASGEYIRVRATDTEISWVPTPEFIAASGAATQSFFNAYGSGVTINGPILTRADVSAIVGTTSGAFNSLPANLPVFGRVEKVLPIDPGGVGDPQDQYLGVARMDFSLSSATQAYVRYAYQNQETEAGSWASSPYPGYDTGITAKNHNLLGSVTHIFSPTLTSQTKVSYSKIQNEQPLNGDPSPTLYMNPTTVVRLQGYRIAFPGYLPWNPGSAIPSGGPQKQLALYQDFNLVKGNHDLRFGGYYMHMADDHTFGAYANSVQSLNTTSAALPSLNNLVLGQIQRYQGAINPNGYPGGTYTTPVGFPSFLSNNRYHEFALYANDTWSVTDRLKVNIGLRYEYFGPQTKSEPKYDANFYYSDDNCSVSTSSITAILDCVRGGQNVPSNESSIGALWAKDLNDFAPRIGFAYDLKGDGKTSLRGGYGMAYERNFGNVTYNVLFNPPEYLVASIDAPTDTPTLPIYTDNQGPFGGVAGVTKPIPAGSLRHVDQNIKTAYTHFYSLSLQHEIMANTVGSVEYTGSTGRDLYDLADPNKRGAGLVYQGIGTASQRPNTQYAAFNTRGNRGQSQYHGVTFGLESRRIGATGLQLTAKYTLSQAKDNLSSTFSDSGANYNLGFMDAFDPMLDYGFAEFDIRHRAVIGFIWEPPIFKDSVGLAKTLLGGWQLSGLFTARSGRPFTLWDCTNGSSLCMRAEDPVGIDKNATSGPATENPNEFRLLDLSPLVPYAGGYVNEITGNSDFGPYPADMTERDAFRGPGAWNLDLSLSKRFRVGERYAVQVRCEAYNVFNHSNMYVNAANADMSSFTEITGYKNDNRRIQLAAKFEF